MKKWMLYILVGSLMAGSASAAWWPFGSKEEPKEQPVVERQQGERPGMQRRDLQDQQGQQGKKGQQISEEKRAEMKAKRAATQELVAAARAETDPVKKAALVDKLRAMLVENAEKMQVEFRKRLEKAEGDVEKMKKRLAEAEKDRSQRIEKQIQKMLSGEKPERSEGKRTGGKRPDGSLHKKSAPVAE